MTYSKKKKHPFGSKYRLNIHASRKFCQNGSNSLLTFLGFFLFYKGREDPNVNVSGPSSAPQQNATDGGPTLNSGLVALLFFRGSGLVLLRNTNFCDFSGGVRTPCPRLWIRAFGNIKSYFRQTGEHKSVTCCCHDCMGESSNFQKS